MGRTSRNREMLLTVEEVAAKLRMTPTGARRLLVRKAVPTVKVGRRRLVEDAVVEDLIRQHTAGGASA